MAEQHTVQPEILAVITFGSLAPNDVFNPIGGMVQYCHTYMHTEELGGF